MKVHRSWSYRPYRPLFAQTGNIYICQVIPAAESIYFAWLEISGVADYKVFFRERGLGEFRLAGSTGETSFTLRGLEEGREYEFYVTAGEKTSRVRLARCGAAVDTVVNYLHPEDEAYSFSGKFLCSPSLVRHPDGYLLASMDVYAGGYPQNLTLIFCSDDQGHSWHYVSELFPCFWGRLFIYEKELYMLGCSTEYGDVLIGKSCDGGRTFTEPSVLLRGSNGKNGEAGWHKNPQPVVAFGGRIWNSLEYGSWGRGYHAPAVISARVGSDLLDPDSWVCSEPVAYNPQWKGLPAGESAGNIEGALVIREGALYNVMRYDMTRMKPNFGLVVSYRVDTKNPEAPLQFDRPISLPGNHTKFVLQYDEKRKKYYTIIARITEESRSYHRNLLSLMSSVDLETWVLERDIFDCRDADPNKIGFQYVDFLIENDKILYLSRTAINGAKSYHDSNYSTFGVLQLD